MEARHKGVGKCNRLGNFVCFLISNLKDNFITEPIYCEFSIESNRKIK